MCKRVCSLFLFLLITCFISGCGGGGRDESAAIVFSDIHFDPFYDPSLFQELVSADATEWPRIFETSKISAPSAPGSDTNYPLLKFVLSSLRRQAGSSAIIIYNGDLLGHYIPQTFFKLYGSEDIAAMKAFTDKTLAFVMEEIRSSAVDVPVIFALGNSDSYVGNGPDSSFLSNTAELYYTKFISGTADHQAFLESFLSGGYYTAEPLGKNLVVVALNTIMFSPMGAGNSESSVSAELAWLESKLATAKAEAKKVWLLMHVPAGADITSTAKTVDSSGRLANATMMWEANYQARFLQILSKYPDVLTLSFAGHTHMDEYRIVSDRVFHVSPGISPCFGNNPAYKLFTFSRATFEAVDYTSLNFDLAAMPKNFNSYYTFSSSYSMSNPLDAALKELLPELLTDEVKQSLYREYYYSGENSLNPVNATNWPVYWCGIDKLTQEEIVDCVNSYVQP